MDRTKGGALRTVGVAFGLYLLLSVLLWWQVWSNHPTSTTSCGCGDGALFLWFLEWPAYAITHGHNPFYSTALFHPAGINLLSNTSVLAVGIPLAPVTWLFGPVATLNVASTLGPALSALAMCWLLLRWVSWRPAAFVGGLLFGFSPFVVVNVAGGHLMTGTLVLLPLIVGCLDELLVRQRHRPVVVGAVLGVLVAAQFFVSTEILVITAICVVIGLVLAVGYFAASDVGELAQRTPYALRGMGAGVACASVLLAYPLWFALAGPAHVSGLVWPGLGVGAGSAHLSNLVNLRHMSAAFAHQMKVWGGYEGPRLPLPEYLGAGAVVVAVLALVLRRRDRRLWLFGAVGAASVALSLGLRFPWRAFGSVPVLQNVLPGRFQVATTLCVAVLLGIAVDGVHEWATSAERNRLRWGVESARNRLRWGVESARTRGTASTTRAAAAIAATAVAAVALVPMGAAFAGNFPLTAQRVVVPPWFSGVGARLPPGQVVLVYPAPFTVVQSAMAWQAVDSLQFAIVGGGGPEGVTSRAGPERAGFEVVSRASLSLSGPPPPTSTNVAAVRQALTGWGVTLIVVPDPAGLPRYDQGTNLASALGLFTAAVGRAPSYEDHAWVWRDVRTARPRQR